MINLTFVRARRIGGGWWVEAHKDGKPTGWRLFAIDPVDADLSVDALTGSWKDQHENPNKAGDVRHVDVWLEVRDFVFYDREQV